MLNHLSIKNYALIDDVRVQFASGFTCITGETGAGKSILLDGLSLVLGKRADLAALRDTQRKCIVEAEFEIGPYDFKAIFDKNDLDYEPQTILRREILPSGKSRAFINDTPVTLDVLSQLGNRLIDVHSQHQTLQLTENDFQLRVIDALANNKDHLLKYSKELERMTKTSKELDELLALQNSAIKEHDYNSFLLSELEAAPLEPGIQQELEEQHEQLSNVETIMEELSRGHQLLNEEQMGIRAALVSLKQISGKLSRFGTDYAQLDARIESLGIEAGDIASEWESFLERTDANPMLLEEIGRKLQLLYDLQKKHGVQDIGQLLEIKVQLSEKVAAVENLDQSLASKEKQLERDRKVLGETAEVLTKRRAKVLDLLKKRLEQSLAKLGMPSATFKIELSPSPDFKSNGKDQLLFLFSANKGTRFGALKKVASGGELSRIMLTIKSILAQYERLPTIMFDEIDTGVSGEISNRMADIMQSMSKTMQVFSITHLPQVASKGDQHFKVYKTEENGITRTQMKRLTDEERVLELAEMLGGKHPTDSAMAHARQLLN